MTSANAKQGQIFYDPNTGKAVGAVQYDPKTGRKLGSGESVEFTPGYGMAQGNFVPAPVSTIPTTGSTVIPPQTPTNQYSDNSNQLLQTIQQQLLAQSGILSSNENEITSRIDSSIEALRSGTEAGNKKLQSEFERNASYLGDKFESDLAAGRAAGAGGILNMAAFRSLVETTDKSLKDLAMRKEELVLQNNFKAAEKITELEIKAIEAKEEASRQYFSNLLNLGNFALNVKNDQDASKKEFSNLIQDNPQAGILATDTYEQALAKVAKNPNSPDVLYKKAQIENIRSEIANRGKNTGGGTVGEREIALLALYASRFLPNIKMKDGTPTIDENGYATPKAFKAAIGEANINRKTFITQFGYLLFPNSNDDNNPFKAYGLTPQEAKLIIGS